MKYILAQSQINGNFVPVVFGDEIVHKDFRRVIPDHHKIIGAGYIVISQEGDITVGGESKSLKIKAGPHDATVISIFLATSLSGQGLTNYLKVLNIHQNNPGAISAALVQAQIEIDGKPLLPAPETETQKPRNPETQSDVIVQPPSAEDHEDTRS